MEIIGFVAAIVGLLLALFAEAKRRGAEQRARIEPLADGVQVVVALPAPVLDARRSPR